MAFHPENTDHRSFGLLFPVVVAMAESQMYPILVLNTDLHLLIPMFLQSVLHLSHTDYSTPEEVPERLQRYF